MHPREQIEQFRALVCSGGSADDSAARNMHAVAIAALGSVDVSGELRGRLSDALDAALAAHLGVLRTTRDDFDPVRSDMRGEPGFLQFLNRRRSVCQQLEALLEQVDRRKVQPDGYTASTLRAEADIGKSLWQTLCARAGMSGARGDAHRRFSNNDVRRLIEAARAHGKRKGESAAQAWEALLERNR